MTSHNIVASVGFVCLVSGSAWIYPPAGLLVAGVVLLGLAVWGYLRC